jgi:biotin transport system substrate-specific component
MLFFNEVILMANALSATANTLAEAIFSTRTSAALRNAAFVVIGSLLLAISAKTQVPMYPVPMTMQSFMVIFLGAALGPRLGVAAVALYLAQGLAGFPVFAAPVAGPASFVGPTGGFLVSFLIAAWISGHAAQRGASLLRVGFGLLAAHALIMIIGFAWLAFFAQLANGATGVGIDAAWARGVLPFLIGTGVKVALATALIAAGWSLVNRQG